MNFPLEKLPGSIRSAIEAQRAIGDYPVEAVAPAALAIVAFATQAIADVELLHSPDRPGPTSQFYMVLARSGDAKSSVFEGLMEGPKRWEQRRLGEFSAQMIAYDAEQRVWAGQMKKAERAGESKELADLLRARPIHPLDPRNILSKTTTNGVYRTFETGWPSMGLMTSEGGSLLAGHSLRSDNSPAEFASMMTMLWDGAPIDRTTGETSMRMLGRRMSALIMVQPEVATEFLTNHVLKRQGLHARFLISSPPPYVPPKAKFLDPASDALLASQVARLGPFAVRIEELLDQPMRLSGTGGRELRPFVVGWDKDAKAHIGDWYDGVARQWRIDDPDPFFARGMEHACRIAASLTVFDRFPEFRPALAAAANGDERLDWVDSNSGSDAPVISLDCARAATAIVEWFAHQRRALALPVTHERDTREADYVERVVKFMQSQQGPIRMRDLLRNPLQRVDRAVRERILESMLKDDIIQMTEVVSGAKKWVEYRLTA